MKLKTDINMINIIFDLYKKDLDLMKKNQFYDIDDVTYNELQELYLSLDINQVVIVADRLMKSAVEEQNIEKSILFSNFLYRYIYFMKTYMMWNNYATDDELVIGDLGEFFLENIAPFFENQITFLIENFIKSIPVTMKSKDLKILDEIDEMLIHISNTNDFDAKLHQIEEFTLFLQNTKRIFTELEIIDAEAKEDFLMLITEIKVDLQTMNNLIVKIIEKIKGMKKE